MQHVKPPNPLVADKWDGRCSHGLGMAGTGAACPDLLHDDWCVVSELLHDDWMCDTGI